MNGNPTRLASVTKRAVATAITAAAIGTVATLSLAPRASASMATQTITLNTGGNWAEGYGYTNASAAAYLDNQGVVHLEGAVAQPGGSGSDWIGTLPTGFAPGRTVYTIAQTLGGTYADLDIRPNGQIWLYRTANANTAFVSLEGISWYNGANPAQAIMTSPYFSTTNGPVGLYDAWPAGAYEDGDGTVHLQGAVSQTEQQAGYPQWIGILPGGLNPGHDVFTIVPTFAGTYADLEIDTSGNLWLLPSPGSNLSNRQFVSLEGVTYSQQRSYSITLNPNWTGIQNTDPSHPSYGAVDPGWNVDGAGVVHLSGAVRQLNTEQGYPQLIGTVGLAPSQDVFTIVHTLAGTYADLVIDTSGNIWLLPSPNTNANFVSLEGVTYVASEPFQL
jgi:hypothetical protein